MVKNSSHVTCTRPQPGAIPAEVPKATLCSTTPVLRLLSAHVESKGPFQGHIFCILVLSVGDFTACNKQPKEGTKVPSGSEAALYLLEEKRVLEKLRSDVNLAVSSKKEPTHT